MYPQAIEILDPLLKEIRKIDDKLMLVELQLAEAKVYHSLENLSKSKVNNKMRDMISRKNSPHLLLPELPRIQFTALLHFKLNLI